MTTEILNAISTVGFPIVMCFLFYNLINKTLEDLKKTISNNTLVMTEVLKRMENMNE